MKILRVLYTGYCFLVFCLLFVIFFFPFLIPITFPAQHRLVGILNRWWAKCLCTLIALPWKIEYRFSRDPAKTYIFCANHFSYFDIAAMALNPHNTIFVGKELGTIPLFGFMYRKLHIIVNRASLKSRYETMVRSLRAIDEGKSLVIFPEGGIITEKEPIIHRFKDGAFRTSIEKQIPIVPVTIPYNWIILPPDEFLVRWHPLKVIFHEPIDPAGFTLEDIDAYKEKVRSIIDRELNKHLTHEHQPRTA